MSSLSPVQKKILDYIKKSYRDRGFPPSLREIGQKFKIASTNGVRYHLKVLADQGYLLREKGTSRGIKLAPQESARLLDTLPIIGKVAAGVPSLATETWEDSLGVDMGIFGLGDESQTFGLRVRGFSMRDAGILEGDIAVVKRQENADPGDIVVAVLEGEATVKKFERTSRGITLQPANPEFDPIEILDNGEKREFFIAGKVVGIIRPRMFSKV